MSAPPLVDPPAMPTMVSRLPKFGSRSKPNAAQTSPAAAANTAATVATATGTRLTNGFYHHPGPAGVNGGLAAPPSSVKQNGFIRAPTAMKWRRENGPMEEGGAEAEGEWRKGKGGNVGQGRHGNSVHQYYSQRQQVSPVMSQGDAKKMATTTTGRGRGLGQSVTSSPQSGPRTLPVSKGGSKPSGSRPSSGTKMTLNLPRGGTTGSLRPPQGSGSGPGSRSGSPLQKKPPASRSHSSDHLDSASSIQLTDSDRLRSRSLTQVQQQPSPSPSTSTSTSTSSLSHSPSLTRPPSINMAPDRDFKELTAQARPSQAVEERCAGVKVQSASRRSGVNAPSLLLPSALKKPLLPSLGPASKPSGISYKLSRPSFINKSRPLRVTTANGLKGDQEVKLGQRGGGGAETPPSTGNSAETTPEAPETEGLSTEPVSQAEVSIVGETLEDMSLSSTSSLDRNDTSQEYMDDFDNLGSGGVGLMLLSSSKNDEDDSGLDQSCARFDDDKLSINGVTKATGLCFLDDGMDWPGMRLSGDRAEHHGTRRQRCSQQEYHDQGGSSLDLSPSDSCGSGGTYMWDEEGLEPLGGAVTSASINTNGNTTHHIGSFDSDLNSIDILNNLDSCDLEDDDLMLDADFAEDVSLNSDGDGMSHMAQWRRRQLCWGTQDVHNDNESDFQCYKLTEDPGNMRTDTIRDSDLILDLCPSRSPCLSPGSPGLGLDVEELADDCSAVRSQLEYLQKLLLQEEDMDDDTLTTDTLSPETNDSSHSSDTQVQVQVQALLQEVQQLREELRSRDRTIAQLTLQLTVPTATTRCHCQETTGRMDRHTQTSVAEKESVASQTPWKEHTSQVLHPSSQKDQEPLMDPVPPPPPPTQALPPANPCSKIPADANTANSAPECRGDDGKRPRKEDKRETKERRGGAGGRSLKLPQPSKLHLFQSLSSAPTAAPPPKTRKPRPLSMPLYPESSASSGGKLKAPVSSGSSRLPKPKSH